MTMMNIKNEKTMNRRDLAALLRTTEKNLNARIVGLKIGPVCSRCGGSGRYSFNQVDGDRCYGCRGAGNCLPSEGAFAATCERAKVVAADGTLDTYIARIQARARCKNASKRVFAAWQAMDALNGYDKSWRTLDALPNKEEVVANNKVGVDLCDTIQKLDQGEKTDWVEFERVLSAGLTRLAEITASLKSREAQ
jgi:hypothetical protein